MTFRLLSGADTAPAAPKGTYATPAGRHRTSIEVRRSVFITTVDVAQSVEAARFLVKEIRNELPRAGHHVYAFMIGFGASVVCGSGDDREPSGTAGPPTLAAVQASGVGDLCVVTSRFFGGVKLGTGGLVRAYGEAARTALKDLPTVCRRDWARVRIVVPYAHYEQVAALLHLFGAKEIRRQPGREMTLEASVPHDSESELANRIAEATAGQVILDAAKEPDP